MSKLFSLDEANALLPQLERIVEELRSTRESISDAQRDASEVARQARRNGHDRTGDISEARRRLSDLISSFDSRIKSISELGCELKDLEIGLFDFRSLKEGRIVYLCWKVGEPEIGFWHDLQEGYAGRRRL